MCIYIYIYIYIYRYRVRVLTAMINGVLFQTAVLRHDLAYTERAPTRNMIYSII